MFRAWPLLSIVIFLLLGGACPAWGWKIAPYKGLAYVSVAEVAEFYRFQLLSGQSDDVEIYKKSPDKALPDVRVTASVGSKLATINRIKFFLSYPVVRLGASGVHMSAFDLIHILDPIIEPGQLREPSRLRTVIIDPAKGGKDTGYSTKLLKEKDLTLDMARRLVPQLQAMGLTVFLTREADLQMSVKERLALVNAQKGEALFISLQAGVGSGSEQGIETATLPPCGTPATVDPDGSVPDLRFFPGNVNDRESMALALAVHGCLVYEAKAKDLGLRRQRAEELKGISMPGVVVRLGRLANPVEAKLLSTESYKNSLATAIIHGIDRYARVMAMANEEPVKPLTFEKVEVFPDQVRSLKGELVRVRATIQKNPDIPSIDPSQVTLQVFFLDQLNGEELDLSTCDEPQANWISVLPNWRDSPVEVVEFTYRQPAYDATMLKSLGRRIYYGFVLRLIYQDRLMEEYAEPANLKRGLSNFTPVGPMKTRVLKEETRPATPVKPTKPTKATPQTTPTPIKPSTPKPAPKKAKK